MSLDVPTALLERAEAGPVDDDAFVACVRDSLPYAWTVISGVAADLARDGSVVIDHRRADRGHSNRVQGGWR